MPRAFLIGRLVRSLRLAFKNAHAEAEMSLRPDALFPLPMQHQIEWIVRRMRRRGYGLVVILEEIDRAAPAVTRHAILSAERSFKLPGVTVILPYVEEHLWIKAFNPLNPAPPDLGGTLESLLEQELLAEERTKAVGGEESAVADRPPEFSEPHRHDARTTFVDWQNYRLLRRFATFDEHRRNRLYRRFSEKYLGGYRVDIGRYSCEDAGFLITEKASLFRLAQERFSILARVAGDEARAAVREAVCRYHPGLTVCHLRHFESFYMRLLQIVPSGLGEAVARPRGEKKTVRALAELMEKLALEGRPNGLHELLDRISEEMQTEDEALRAVARFLAAIAALAAWHEGMMHAEN